MNSVAPLSLHGWGPFIPRLCWCIRVTADTLLPNTISLAPQRSGILPEIIREAFTFF